MQFHHSEHVHVIILIIVLLLHSRLTNATKLVTINLEKLNNTCIETTSFHKLNNWLSD